MSIRLLFVTLLLLASTSVHARELGCGNPSDDPACRADCEVGCKADCALTYVQDVNDCQDYLSGRSELTERAFGECHSMRRVDYRDCLRVCGNESQRRGCSRQE